jgi:hypothetical protein
VHTYICIYIYFIHKGPYSPAAKAEAAQRKREEEEAAERAAAGTHFTSITGTKVQILTYCCVTAVEEEALRIVGNIQNFLEKFDPSLRFLTSRH